MAFLGSINAWFWMVLQGAFGELSRIDQIGYVLTEILVVIVLRNVLGLACLYVRDQRLIKHKFGAVIKNATRLLNTVVLCVLYALAASALLQSHYSNTEKEQTAGRNATWFCNSGRAEQPALLLLGLRLWYLTTLTAEVLEIAFPSPCPAQAREMVANALLSNISQDSAEQIVRLGGIPSATGSIIIRWFKGGLQWPVPGQDLAGVDSEGLLAATRIAVHQQDHMMLKLINSKLILHKQRCIGTPNAEGSTRLMALFEALLNPGSVLRTRLPSYCAPRQTLTEPNPAQVAHQRAETEAIAADAVLRRRRRSSKLWSYITEKEGVQTNGAKWLEGLTQERANSYLISDMNWMFGANSMWDSSIFIGFWVALYPSFGDIAVLAVLSCLNFTVRHLFGSGRFLPMRTDGQLLAAQLLPQCLIISFRAVFIVGMWWNSCNSLPWLLRWKLFGLWAFFPTVFNHLAAQKAFVVLLGMLLIVLIGAVFLLLTVIGQTAVAQAEAGKAKLVPPPRVPGDMPDIALQTAPEGSIECKICMWNVARIIFLPCGHVCSCHGCSKKLLATTNLCPMCQQPIQSAQVAYM